MKTESFYWTYNGESWIFSIAFPIFSGLMNTKWFLWINLFLFSCASCFLIHFFVSWYEYRDFCLLICIGVHRMGNWSWLEDRQKLSDHQSLLESQMIQRINCFIQNNGRDKSITKILSQTKPKFQFLIRHLSCPK